ncbi:MAG: hypothetical protein H6822_14060 [Planctomycetaceae bacterium]|nr:hypothetical protein [Planctomycetales bacterium]MCB9923302.1 hypothetical protein [Planctomycetaceae bacterium]
MTHRRIIAAAAAGLLAISYLPPSLAEQVDVELFSAVLRAVGPKGEGHAEASKAWQRLSEADAQQLPEILAGMKGSGRLGENWFRAAIEAVAQREVRNGGKLPIDALEGFLADTRQSPRARRLAYELIASVDASAEERLIPGLLNDPSLELRRDAVALALKSAAAAEQAGEKDEAARIYAEAFAATRELDQIKEVTKKLREFEQQVDVPRHMGFVLDWHLIGPFDNTGMRAFDVAYPPEKEIDLAASYEGKVGQVQWKPHRTTDEFGIVDLNQIFERPKDGNDYRLTNEHKGAIGYAVAIFESEQARDVEIRMGCINANKIWLNGELLTANQVYHAGMEVDQYVAQGRLKQGKNEILVKVCQNEQEESWAQRWQFQLRVCDSLGTAVLAKN